MAVAEVELDGVAADGLPAGDAHVLGDFGGGSGQKSVSGEVALADVFRAGGVEAQEVVGKVVFAVVGPEEGEFVANNFDFFQGQWGLWLWRHEKEDCTFPELRNGEVW